MMRRGHKVVIACQPGSGILARALEQGIPSEEVVIRGSYDVRAVRDLFRLIRKHRITVVNTHSGKDTWVGSFAARLAGTALLVRTRHLSVPISQNPLNFIHRMSDGIITTGVAIRDRLVRNNGIDPERIVSIATGVPVGRFDPDLHDRPVLKKRFGLSEDSLVVTMVAVLRSMKRHDLFVRAAALLKNSFPKVRFLVVGEGPARESIERLIREEGVEDIVILAGYRQDIPEIFSFSDVAVLTSDRFEGVPQSLSQAMAMGKAVVAAPVGSIPELVQDGVTGLLAETGSAESFAGAIGTLVADEQLRKELGEKARAHIRAAYTDDIMAEKTIAFYRHLLERKAAGRR